MVTISPSAENDTLVNITQDTTVIHAQGSLSPTTEPGIATTPPMLPTGKA